MIFLDSSLFIALILENDINHEKAKVLIESLGYERKIINTVVIFEVLNSLNNWNLKLSIDDILDKLCSLDKIDFLNKKDVSNSLRIFKYYNQSINFADCAILKTMFDNKVNKIVSFDSDFDKIDGIERIYL